MRVYAHRGASLEFPENTLPAFRRAVELGADALETDVHVTADGVLVLSHDPDGGRVFGVRRRIGAASRMTEMSSVQSPPARASMLSGASFSHVLPFLVLLIVGLALPLFAGGYWGVIATRACFFTTQGLC